MITRDTFIRPLAVKKIEIEELNDCVFIRRFSGADRAAYLKKSVIVDGKNINPNYEELFGNMTRLVAMSLCDENSKRIFNDSDEDLKLLNEQDALILQKIYEESARFNGLGEEAVKEAAKN